MGVSAACGATRALGVAGRVVVKILVDIFLRAKRLSLDTGTIPRVRGDGKNGPTGNRRLHHVRPPS